MNFHNTLADNVQNHQFDISQSFELYRDWSIYSERVLNHTTFQQPVQLNLNDLDCRPSHHLKILFFKFEKLIIIYNIVRKEIHLIEKR